jgi:hypothetical protein
MAKIINGYLKKLSHSDYKFDLTSNSLLLLHSFPVYMGCTDEPTNNDIHVDMTWEMNSNTLKVFPVLPSEVIYPFSHNDSVGLLWAQHHEFFAQFIVKHASGIEVYEIGGAHGMAYIYAKSLRELKWTIHDINPIPVSEYDQRIIKGKFTNSTYLPAEETHTIVHSHTLEHVNDPVKFMSEITLSQKIGDKQIISVPNMDLMLERVDLNFLNFEHNYFIPEKLLISLFKACGYQVNEIFDFQKHSKFYALEKISDLVSLEDFFLQDYLDVPKFHTYFAAIEKYVAEINQVLESSQIPTYIFGAHVFTQMLIGFGLKEDLISGCIDNSQNKQSKRLYGTSLIVCSPEVMFENNQTVNIIGALANYTSEIEKDLSQWKSQINSIYWFSSGETLKRL